MAAKKTEKPVPIPILIMIYAVLLYATYTSISTLVLAIWGDSVIGTVYSYDSQLYDSRAEANRSRAISKSYTFVANGKGYKGHVIYSSDEAWPRLRNGETRSERIRYLAIFPYINKPSMLCDFDEMGEAGILYHIFAPIACIFLLRLVIRTSGAEKKNKKTEAGKPAPRGQAQIRNTRSETDMFCPNCGNKLPEGAVFCSNCGAKMQSVGPNVCTACGTALPDGAEFCISCGQAVSRAAPKTFTPPPAAAPAPPQGGTGLIGFSDRCNHPEILAAAQENKKFAVGCMWVLLFVPLIGFPLAGLLMDDFPFGESVVVGIGLALVMLILNLLRLRETRQPMWEGVVVNQYSKERNEHRDEPETYTEFTTVIRTDTGKKKTIVEKNSQRHMYDYLAVGDRVRYHPKFGTYEKYDKSKDRIIYCNVCSMMNPIQNDRCKRCNNLLFK
ncbi:MAG: zinc ribbon domain-containing protein [Oscillospiraceae bacterium]|jgi:hypothetical protein